VDVGALFFLGNAAADDGCASLARRLLDVKSLYMFRQVLVWCRAYGRDTK
jgi:hypothetical protein